MAGERFSPWQQAEREMPTKWYEIRNRKQLGLLQAAQIVAAIAGYEAVNHFSSHDSIATHIVGGAIYSLSVLADHLSTVRVLNTGQRAKELDTGVTIREENPIIGRVTTAKDFNKNPRTWIGHAVGLPAVLYNVGFALPVPFARSIAVASNIRLAKRTERAIEIAQKNNSDR